MTKYIPDGDLSGLPDAQPQDASPPTSIVRDVPDENLARFPDAAMGDGRTKEQVQLGARAASPARVCGQLWFWLLLTLLSLAAFSLVTEISWFLRRSSEMHPVYGWIGGGIIGVFVLLLLTVVWREVRAYLRLKSCQTLQHKYCELEAHPRDARLNKEVQQLVRDYLTQLRKTAKGELLARIHRAEARMALADDALVWKEDLEQTVLAAMDEQVRQVIRQEATNVGLGTAVSLSGFFDVAITLWRNVRLVTRIAALYQLRTGTYGALRLVRETLTAVALADLSEEAWNLAVSPFGTLPLFTRVGEGILNAGLTVRIGLQAQRECRPVAFSLAQQHSALSELMGVIGGAIRATVGWPTTGREVAERGESGVAASS